MATLSPTAYALHQPVVTATPAERYTWALAGNRFARAARHRDTTIDCTDPDLWVKTAQAIWPHARHLDASAVIDRLHHHFGDTLPDIVDTAGCYARWGVEHLGWGHITHVDTAVTAVIDTTRVHGQIPVIIEDLNGFWIVTLDDGKYSAHLADVWCVLAAHIPRTRGDIAGIRLLDPVNHQIRTVDWTAARAAQITSALHQLAADTNPNTSAA